MNMALTPYLWLDWIVVGFLFGVGFAVAGSVVAWVKGQISKQRASRSA